MCKVPCDANDLWFWQPKGCKKVHCQAKKEQNNTIGKNNSWYQIAAGIHHYIKQIGNNKDWYQVADKKTYSIVLMLLVTIVHLCIQMLFNCPLATFLGIFCKFKKWPKDNLITLYAYMWAGLTKKDIAHDNFFTQIQSYMNVLLDFSVRHGLW